MKYEFSISYSVGDSFSKDSFLWSVWNAYSFLQCWWNKYIEKRQNQILNSYYKGNEYNQTNKDTDQEQIQTAQAATAHTTPTALLFPPVETSYQSVRRHSTSMCGMSECQLQSCRATNNRHCELSSPS